VLRLSEMSWRRRIGIEKSMQSVPKLSKLLGTFGRRSCDFMWVCANGRTWRAVDREFCATVIRKEEDDRDE
jgi:hypothetical protein